MADPGSASKAKRSSNAPRKRVSQACDRCRARKDKCDGQKPVCSTCASQDAVCNYDSNTKKRGLPEGYVRGIEKLWGLSIRQIDELEESVIEVLSSENTAEVWKETPNTTETLQETWRNSRIAKELERLLPLLEVDEKAGKRKRDGGRGDSISEARPPARTALKDHDNSGFPAAGDKPKSSTEPGSQADAQLLDTSLISGGELFSRSIKPPGTGIEFRSSSFSSRGRPETQTPEKLPERTFHLIDIYFSYTHSWFPILEKYDIMRFSHQYSMSKRPQTGGSGQSAQSTGDHAVLWAVLAYADHQRIAFTGLQEPVPSNMYSYARDLIPREDEIFEIGHIQALLILTLYNMGKGFWSRSWVLIGRAARMAVDLGLEQLDTPISKRSQHVFLGCFVLDTIVAARLKRRPQLRREDLGRINRVEEDGLEEWDPYNDSLNASTTEALRGPAVILSTWNQLIRVLAILNDIICVSPGSTTSFSSYQILLRDLQSLNHPLPPQFRPGWQTKSRDTTSGPILPHQYHLHMAYICTIAKLYISARTEGYQLERSAEEIAGSTIRQTAKLLKHHAQHFGLFIMPPTYDFYTIIAGQCVSIDENPLDDYRLDIQHSLSTMCKAWPTYYIVDGLFSTGELGSIPEDQQGESYVAVSSKTVTPRPQVSQQLVHTRPESFRETLAIARSTDDQIQVPDPLQRNSPVMSRYNSNDQELLVGFGKSPLVDLSMTNLQHMSPTASFVPQTPIAASWSGVTPGRENFGSIAHSSASVFDGTAGSIDIDGDSMFNEFATLDAMEWTNNWDQSLLNLGFTDPRTMNQDFYAFARDPDPLYPNNLVQQLLSSSNLNANSGLEDTGESVNARNSGVHGYNMDNPMMNYPNPHVEASQILQALATAQERNGGSQNAG